MALPTSNLSVNLIYTTLGVSNGRDLFYVGATLKTVAQLGLVVNKNGLNPAYCPGADADARLANLLADRKLSYFKGYDPIVPSKYGYLYNAYAYTDTSFAPNGWHVPTHEELTILGEYIDSSGTYYSNIAGGALKEVGFTHWKTPNTGAVDTYSFSARGAGYRRLGFFGGLTEVMFIACSNLISGKNVVGYLFYAFNQFEYPKIGAGWIEEPPETGISVRLIKDDNTNPGTIVDYDGNVYDCVTIGNQVWIVQNWKCTKLNNGTTIPTVTDGNTWAGLTSMAKCAYNNDEGNV